MTKEKYVAMQVKRLKENGYNPIHLFGTWYLVRHKSKNYTKIPIYSPYNVAKLYNQNIETSVYAIQTNASD